MNRTAIWLVSAIVLAHGAEATAAQFFTFGDLPGRGRLEIQDISADGRVVVGTVIHDQEVENIGPRAFRWSLDEGLTVLADDRSGALGVSADGSIVVGTVSTDDLGRRA